MSKDAICVIALVLTIIMNEQETPRQGQMHAGNAGIEIAAVIESNPSEMQDSTHETNAKLNPEQQFPISQPSVAAILHEYGIDEFTFRAAKSGVENVTLLVDSASRGEFAMRVYRQDKKSTPEIAEEVEFSNYLKGHGIPVPEVFETTDGQTVSETIADGKSWQSLLMEFKDGTHAEEYDDALINQMAVMQAKMHVLGIEFAEGRAKANVGQERLLPNARLSDLDPASMADPRLGEFIQRAQAFEVSLDPSLPSGFSHFDFDRGNLLVADNTISAVLDFDDTKCGPLIMCLANTLWNVMATTGDEADLRLYVDKYQETRALSGAELGSIQEIMLFRHYMVSGMRTGFGETDEASISGFIDLENKILSLEAFSV